VAWAAAVLLNLLAMPALAADATATLDLDEYVLTFNEEFDSLDVSAWGKPPSRWIAHTPWAGDFGDAAFADPRPGFPFTVADGVLRIEARKRPDGRWESGLLSANDPKGRGFAQTFGYFEVRAKLPPGKGVWPAFWLVSVERDKFTAEIDVLEYYGHAPDRFHSVVHIWRHGEGEKDDGQDHVTKVDTSLTDRFNTFGVDVQPDWTVFYFNRREVWRIETWPGFVQPMFPLVNLALGSGWPIDETPNPSYMWVDYVRVYARKEQ
jgi:beta-glucanase (GH16 family)